jgi:CheY-like chemotaxis protein
LELANYEVWKAKDGKEAVKQALDC